MEIDDAGELLFRTYYMLDWKVVRQGPSEQQCAACGREMMKLEPTRDRKGLVYDGLVCHGCKAVYWVKRD